MSCFNDVAHFGGTELERNPELRIMFRYSPNPIIRNEMPQNSSDARGYQGF